jgi:RNA polymerase primary sigma factor
VSKDAPLQDDEDTKFIDVFVAEDTPATDENLINESLKAEIDRSLSTLSPKEREIVCLYYGIGQNYALTLDEIGAKFNLTRERVRLIGKELSDN